ncbi:MAG: hypothetical protein ACRDIB_13060, partial [Ardenticatenaceae bacterium]
YVQEQLAPRSISNDFFVTTERTLAGAPAQERAPRDPAAGLARELWAVAGGKRIHLVYKPDPDLERSGVDLWEQTLSSFALLPPAFTEQYAACPVAGEGQGVLFEPRAGACFQYPADAFVRRSADETALLLHVARPGLPGREWAMGVLLSLAPDNGAALETLASVRPGGSTRPTTLDGVEAIEIVPPARDDMQRDLLARHAERLVWLGLWLPQDDPTVTDGQPEADALWQMVTGSWRFVPPALPLAVPVAATPAPVPVTQVPAPTPGPLGLPLHYSAPDPVPPDAEAPGTVWLNDQVSLLAVGPEGQRHTIMLTLPDFVDGSSWVTRDLSVSPDHRRFLAWLQELAEPPQRQVLVAYNRNADDAFAYLLPEGISADSLDGAAWSPDSSKVALGLLLGAEPSLAIINVSTGDVRTMPVAAPENGRLRPLGWRSSDSVLLALPWGGDEGMELYGSFQELSTSSGTVVAQWDRQPVGAPALSP